MRAAGTVGVLLVAFAVVGLLGVAAAHQALTSGRSPQVMAYHARQGCGGKGDLPGFGPGWKTQDVLPAQQHASGCAGCAICCARTQWRG